MILLADITMQRGLQIPLAILLRFGASGLALSVLVLHLKHSGKKDRRALPAAEQPSEGRLFDTGPCSVLDYGFGIIYTSLDLVSHCNMQGKCQPRQSA
jgi:hypothetical protein